MERLDDVLGYSVALKHARGTTPPRECVGAEGKPTLCYTILMDGQPDQTVELPPSTSRIDATRQALRLHRLFTGR